MLDIADWFQSRILWVPVCRDRSIIESHTSSRTVSGNLTPRCWIPEVVSWLCWQQEGQIGFMLTRWVSMLSLRRQPRASPAQGRSFRLPGIIPSDLRLLPLQNPWQFVSWCVWRKGQRCMLQAVDDCMLSYVSSSSHICHNTLHWQSVLRLISG